MPNFTYKTAAPAGIAFNKIGHLKISCAQHLFSDSCKSRAGETAQQEKAHASKPDNLSLSLRISLVGGEDQMPQVAL